MTHDQIRRAVMLGILMERNAWDFDAVHLTEDWVIENSVKMLGAMEQAKDDTHSGDCTKECHSCIRCSYERLRDAAEKVMKLAVGEKV